MIVQAHAKINLALNVIERYPNGYHSLDMIMMPLALHDVLTIEKSETLEVEIKGSDLVVDENNTIVRSIHLLQQTFGFTQNFKVILEKAIPMQAGLAGGSADAAATLKAVNAFMELGLSIEELAQLGKQIGADVPFCIYQTCARVKGIGEQIEPMEHHLKTKVLLVKPPQGVPTKEAFEKLDFSTLEHPDLDAIARCIVNKDEHTLYSLLGNSLEQSAMVMVPAIKEIKETLQAAGFDAVLMSGSGSTVFGLSNDEEQLEKMGNYYRNLGYFSLITHFV